MRTRDLVKGDQYEVERRSGERVRATYLGPSADPLDNPLVFMEQGEASPIAGFTTTPRYVIRPWSERVAEQHERAEREAEAQQREAAMFAALYGDLPNLTVSALAAIGITATYRAQPDIVGMTCVLDIEGPANRVSAFYVWLLRADVGNIRRLRIADQLAEYHALQLAGHDTGHLDAGRVGAFGRFTPIELATVLHVANGLAGC